MRTKLVAIGLALSLWACKDSESAPAATSSPDPTTAPAPKPRSPAPPDDTAGGDAGACTGQAGELYALSATSLAGDPVPLCRFAGKVLLVVNTASFCGYTPQLTPLQALYDQYGAQGFAVLGFPSKSFNQEYDSDKDVSTFCTTEYKITFPMFAIGSVKKTDAQPVFAWIYGQPGYEAEIQWNFEKFLVSRQGKLVKRFLTGVSPDAAEVTSAITAELGK